MVRTTVEDLNGLRQLLGSTGSWPRTSSGRCGGGRRGRGRELPPEELREILTIYRAESDEHVERLTAGLLLLEQSPRRAETSRRSSARHTASRGRTDDRLRAVERIAHALEDLFGLARKGELELGRGVFDAVFSALDQVPRLTEAWLADPQAPSPPVDELLASLRAAGGGV